VDPAIAIAKLMTTAISDFNGFHLRDLMPSHCRFNTQCFVEHAMAPLVQTVFPQRRTRDAARLNVHLDNRRAHFSKLTEHVFIENQLLHVPHPPYTPDMARRTSGYSRVSRLDSLAKGLLIPRNY
jgi:hypothetical protein